jgi:hypothetical protein
MNTRIASAPIVFVGLIFSGAKLGAQTPQLPLTIPNSTYPTPTGQSTPVHSSDDIQSAIDAANCGDELVLDAGVTWQGNFTLPNKNCSGALNGGWVIVRTSGESSMPAQGTRATVSDLPYMATLCSANGEPVLANITNSSLTARAAAFYWFEGLEITLCSGADAVFWNAVLFYMPTGMSMPTGPPEDDTPGGMPHDIVFSHSYIHGVPNTDNMIRGLYLDGYNYTVIDSTVNNWQASSQDSQAFMMDCGTGDILIQNNDMEASADSMLIAAPECAQVPGDITVFNNYFTKQTAWYPQFILKNFVEFKNGQRILVTGNVMANGFAAAQDGAGVLINPRTWTGSEAPGTWASVALVSDVTATYNVIHDTGLGTDIASEDSYCTRAMNCIPSARVLFQNNLFYNIDLANASDWCFQLDAPNELTIDHNTCVSANTFSQSLFVDTYPNTDTSVTNNIFSQDVGGQGVSGPAAIALDSQFGDNSGGVIENNGGYAPGWLTATLTEWQSCGCASQTLFSSVSPFANLTTYPVVSGSVFSGAGTDGLDLGWSATTVTVNNILNGAIPSPSQSCATVMPASIYVDSNGGQVALNITTSSNPCYYWSSSSSSWIALGPASAAGTVTASIGSNQTALDQSGTIYIAALGQGAIGVPVFQKSTAAVFSDVPPSSDYFDAANLMDTYGITDGCSVQPLDFCPDDQLNRETMAIFIVRAVYNGSNSFPYSTTPHFGDVSPADFGFPWIQRLFELGITSGCGSGNFCPNDPVTRADLAILIIRMRYGATATFDYPTTPYFTDVTPATFGWSWIQRMAEDNITSGCGQGLYCPNDPVTRGEMAIFIMAGAFNQLLPPGEPVLTSISPAAIAQGASGTFAVTGFNTNFVAGITTIAAIPGIAVGTVTVTGPTTLTVELSAVSGALDQPVSVLAVSGTEEAVLPNGLVIQ